MCLYLYVDHDDAENDDDDNDCTYKFLVSITTSERE